MTFFRLLVFDLRQRGTRLETIAAKLGVTVAYLGQIFNGRFRLSGPVRRRAAELFKVRASLLDQVIKIRDIEALARKACRKVVKCGAPGGARPVVS